ncbi:MAG: hypothetical protein CSA26_09190 [Desulfobacterales bacterium]|nr:MAG: hypothetical protein CSA26_09190 [Desulfobacterales bacterium]
MLLSYLLLEQKLLCVEAEAGPASTANASDPLRSEIMWRHFSVSVFANSGNGKLFILDEHLFRCLKDLVRFQVIP